jgi:hypothetical protein
MEAIAARLDLERCWEKVAAPTHTSGGAMRWERRPRQGRRTGLRVKQWNFDDFDSTEDAVQATEALRNAAIHAEMAETETGPVVIISAKDLKAASKVIDGARPPRLSPPGD